MNVLRIIYFSTCFSSYVFAVSTKALFQFSSKTILHSVETDVPILADDEAFFIFQALLVLWSIWYILHSIRYTLSATHSLTRSLINFKFEQWNEE